MRYTVKCDDCKRTLRETDDVRESYAGGRCDTCKVRAFDFSLHVGQAVNVYWGYGSGFRAKGKGVVERVNRKSVAVKLTEDAPAPYGAPWPAGYVLRGIARASDFEHWNLWNRVEEAR